MTELQYFILAGGVALAFIVGIYFPKISTRAETLTVDALRQAVLDAEQAHAKAVALMQHDADAALTTAHAKQAAADAAAAQRAVLLSTMSTAATPEPAPAAVPTKATASAVLVPNTAPHTAA